MGMIHSLIVAALLVETTPALAQVIPGPDKRWDKAQVSAANAAASMRRYRTTFDLAVPEEQDATIGVSFGDPTMPRSNRAYRVLVFVNGWHMGQFVAHVGPQRIFAFPEGILNHRGRNTLALAVTSDGASGNALETVELVTLRNVRGGVAVRTVSAPISLARSK